MSNNSKNNNISGEMRMWKKKDTSTYGSSKGWQNNVLQGGGQDANQEQILQQIMASTPSAPGTLALDGIGKQPMYHPPKLGDGYQQPEPQGGFASSVAWLWPW